MTASIVRSMKSDALAYNCDCSNEDEVAKLFRQISNEIGPIDILVNNAGILNGKNLLMLSSDEIRKTFDVNVFAHFWVSSTKNSTLAVYIVSFFGQSILFMPCNFKKSNFA